MYLYQGHFLVYEVDVGTKPSLNAERPIPSSHEPGVVLLALRQWMDFYVYASALNIRGWRIDFSVFLLVVVLVACSLSNVLFPRLVLILRPIYLPIPGAFKVMYQKQLCWSVASGSIATAAELKQYGWEVKVPLFVFLVLNRHSPFLIA